MDEEREGVVAAKRAVLELLQGGELHNARKELARLCTEWPDDHELWMLLGLCRMELGHVAEAAAAFKRARQVKPDFPPAHARLGEAYMGQRRFEAALECFEAALRLDPGNPKSLVSIGAALIALGRFDEAVARTCEALRYFPRSAPLHAQLAAALERGHHLEEAKEAAARAVELQPDQPRAQLILATVARREGDLEQARARLDSLLAADLAPQQQAAVATELGRVLEALADYPAAFRAFVRANRAMDQVAGRADFDSQAILRHIRRNQQGFTAESTRGWAEQEPADGYPSPIFLVGFPRSGTTLTEQIIASVDGVVATDEQPILFRLIGDLGTLFGRQVNYPNDLSDLSESEVSWLRLHYWHLVEEMVGEVGEGQHLLDKLPLNLIDLGLVYRLFPKARVVVVQRDPRDSCLSCYAHAFVLNQAMVNCLDLQRTARFYEATMGLWLHYRSFMELPYIEVRYEALVADLEGEARRLIDFLGLPWDDKVLQFYEHARERGVKTPSYSAITTPIYNQAVGRWRHYEAELQPILRILQPFVEVFGYEKG